MLHCNNSEIVYVSFMTIRALSKVMAGLLASLIVFATVCPIEIRPSDPLPVDFDRMLAFIVLAALLTFAFPTKSWTLRITIILSAGGLELLQFLSPTRHTQLDDALVKSFGAAVGIGIGSLANKAMELHRVKTAMSTRS